MTEYDKKRFDEFFHTSKYSRGVTEADFLLDSCKCAKLFDYLQNELTGKAKEDKLVYMAFAYALGKYGG